MKFLSIFLLAACLQVSAEGFSQKISLSEKNASLEKVLGKIKKQSGYTIWYEDKLLEKSKPVSITLQDVSLEEALTQLFKDQPLTYEIIDQKIIAVKEKAPASTTVITTEEKRPPPPITVKGRILNELNEPVQASIIVKGTQNGTSSNADGYFELTNVDEKATLVITGVSIEPQEVKVNSRVTINVTVKIVAKESDEVVVAYGRQKQQAITGSVTVIKGEQIQNLPNRSFDKSLQGLVPGLLVTQGTGQPGGGNSNFVLRGIATAASPSAGSVVRNPLIVIDGIPVTQESPQLYVETDPNVTRPSIFNPLSQLNPSDIESITVLKDAAAIAMYGAKSSNGVILVTTKKGKAGKTRFSFRHQTDVAAAANNQSAVLSQSEYLDLLFETYKNTPRVIGGVSTPWTDADILIDLRKKFPVIVNSPGDTSFYPTPNWEAELFNSAATTFTNEISMSGGNEKSLFYLNFEYTKQNGVVKKTGFDRKSARFNFEHRATDWLKLGLNSTLSQTVQDYGGPLKGGNENAAAFALETSPLLPIRLTNGDYMLNYTIGTVGPEKMNPAAANHLTNFSSNNAFRGVSKLYADINFLKHFSFNSNVGIDFMLAEGKEKVDPRLYDPTVGYGGRIEEKNTRISNFIVNNIIRYNNNFNRFHSLNLLAGHEAQVLNNKQLLIGVKDLSSPYYDQISSPGVTVWSYAGNIFKETMLSYFGQANYSFKGRYLLSGSIRSDGSSRFGEDKRFGTYWSLGAGWVASDEDFAKRLNKWLTFLKFRGSFGAAGNSGAIDRFTPYTPVQSAGYLGNPAIFPSTDDNRLGNPDAKWEKTVSWNAGIDLRMFGDRISLTADMYERNTSDLIYSIPIPLTTGYTIMIANIGKMRNSGMELSVSADVVKTKDFKWNITGNWSTNKNRLTKANTNGLIGGNIVASQVGQPLEAFYLRTWAGVNPADGSPMWWDSTGKASSDYNAAKPAFVGKSQPDGYGSVASTISFKGLELGVQFYYQYGFQVYYSSIVVRDGYQPYANEGKEALDRWQKPGDIAANPKRILNNANPGTQYSTRYLYDGDFIRLQNLSLTYALPSSMLKTLHLTNLKVYLQGNNLALWNKKTASKDPGIADTRGLVEYRYPLTRNFSVGINANF